MRPKAIVVHHSASTFGDAALIRSWHTAKGWSDIGYHAVILNGRRTKDRYEPQLDGKIEPGRPENRIGAHCVGDGMNLKALGVCLIHDGSLPMTYTPAQIGALVHYLATKCKQYNIPVSAITQHSDHEPGKPYCASLDMAAIRSRVAAKLKAV